ncbi:ribonuclease H1 [Penicillium subrubescens]|uniref:Ribonuclease H n=1 Tax=Penicillium subrubescens TaxID=1316194 RepID=A0A1Q5TG46_9EURO|nr:ribonuclease H1 [Penicillium subrubescens]KAJ5890733.1 ribonuclease H1 [Penicillium subrubescens]OKO99155.1 Ribonuclease H [Penicillium subrubescens]
MVYAMEIYTDGGCRGNGSPWAIGAAAAAFKTKWGKYHGWTRILPSYPPPTNQRAEIVAIILALEQALEKYQELDTNPYLDVTIYSDSKYAVNCMKSWIYKWTNNGWINAAGNPVANRDLLEEASDLDDRLRNEGDVEYIWIPREENEVADRFCNEALDRE